VRFFNFFLIIILVQAYELIMQIINLITSVKRIGENEQNGKIFRSEEDG
jgi:hypothetical protein